MIFVTQEGLSYEFMSARFRYDPETGEIFRTTGRASGRLATRLDNCGYLRITLQSRGQKPRWLQAHRVAWLLAHGEWPNALVDHIDGDPTNNTLSNLRLATPQQNNFNRRTSHHSRTGTKGVIFRRGRFEAIIHFRKKQIYLGGFPTLDEAAQAYAAAAKSLYGQFANCPPSPSIGSQS